MLLQSAKLANVASRNEMELQERRILRTSFSKEMQMSTGEREGERHAGKFDCDIPFLFKSLANSPINSGLESQVPRRIILRIYNTLYLLQKIGNFY